MTTNMMGSTYLEATADNGVSMGRGVEGGDVSWMSGIGATAMSYPLDASPYAAESPTTLNSPDGASIDHALFPSAAAGDFSYLDPSFGDFAAPAAAYPMADVSTVSGAQLPLQVGRRAVALPGARYAITSAPNPTLYAPVGALWQQPPHASPTPFLPTPPMADDLSDESAPEDNVADDDHDDEYDDAELDPPKRKRAAGPSSSSSSASGRSKRRTQAQLRTASRAPRKKPNTLPQRPTETVQDVKAREAHNQVEQQYRKRLNAHFERLLSVLPATGPGATSSSLGGRRDGIGEKRVSKAEVLDLATERIRALEKQTARLERERRELRSRLAGCVV